jgi:hypothetical protein
MSPFLFILLIFLLDLAILRGSVYKYVASCRFRYVLTIRDLLPAMGEQYVLAPLIMSTSFSDVVQ